MQIIIDTIDFNKLVKDNKYEILDYLLSKGYVADSSCYLCCSNLEMLNWLYKHGARLQQTDNYCKSIIENYINHDNFLDIFAWFYSNGLIINNTAINYILLIMNVEQVKNVLKKFNLILGIENYKYIIEIQKIELFCLIDKTKCISLEKYILGTKNKDVIKWFINQNLI